MNQYETLLKFFSENNLFENHSTFSSEELIEMEDQYLARNFIFIKPRNFKPREPVRNFNELNELQYQIETPIPEVRRELAEKRNFRRKLGHILFEEEIGEASIMQKMRLKKTSYNPLKESLKVVGYSEVNNNNNKNPHINLSESTKIPILSETIVVITTAKIFDLYVKNNSYTNSSQIEVPLIRSSIRGF